MPIKTTTITALLCIISILSFGQVKLHNENEGMLNQCDSSYGYPTTLQTLTDSNSFVILNNTLAAPSYRPAYPQDTIPVIMLVCDTSKYFGLNQNQTSWAYWIKGYRVDKNNYTALGTAYYPTEYLDENKKKLSKNIIVWQSK